MFTVLYGFVDYSGKGMKSFDVLTGDQSKELEVRTVTYMYGPEIDQSQHTKYSQPHNIIKYLIWRPCVLFKPHISSQTVILYVTHYFSLH